VGVDSERAGGCAPGVGSDKWHRMCSYTCRAHASRGCIVYVGGGRPVDAKPARNKYAGVEVAYLDVDVR